jgi:hypothetical protein
MKSRKCSTSKFWIGLGKIISLIAKIFKNIKGSMRNYLKKGGRFPSPCLIVPLPTLLPAKSIKPQSFVRLLSRRWRNKRKNKFKSL